MVQNLSSIKNALNKGICSLFPAETCCNEIRNAAIALGCKDYVIMQDRIWWVKGYWENKTLTTKIKRAIILLKCRGKLQKQLDWQRKLPAPPRRLNPKKRICHQIDTDLMHKIEYHNLGNILYRLGCPHVKPERAYWVDTIYPLWAKESITKRTEIIRFLKDNWYAVISIGLKHERPF